MDDLISRKALIDWIRAIENANITRKIVGLKPKGLNTDGMMHMALKLPSVDAVEVVRCRDCLYFKCDNGCPLHESGYFKNGKMLPFENDFCSYGERKEKGDGH